jgi:hypothetical protein
MLILQRTACHQAPVSTLLFRFYWQPVSLMQVSEPIQVELVQVYDTRIESATPTTWRTFRSSNNGPNFKMKPPQDFLLTPTSRLRWASNNSSLNDPVLRVIIDDGHRVARELAKGEESFSGSHRPIAIA